jgi:hypothetical protein
MRRRLLILALAIGLVAVPVAIASGAHFIASATSCTKTDSLTLTCSFKEAGLSSGSVENITLSATVSGTISCQNGGGNFPTAKLNQQPVSNTGTFTASKNGNIVGSLSVSPANPCPPGQTEVGSVTYTNVVLTDNTSGASISIPGTF